MSKFIRIALRSLLLTLALAASAGAAPVLAVERQGLSDAEYQRLLKHSPAFEAADRELARTWQSLPSDIRRDLAADQRQWVQAGRDRDARLFMRQGADWDQAYTKATQQRTRLLREYLPSGSHHQRHGRLQGPLTDDNYRKLLQISPEYADADREMTRVWKKLPDRVRKKLLPEQRAWTQTTRDRDAQKLIRDGVGYAEAYTRVTRHRTRVLHDYLTGKLDI